MENHDLNMITCIVQRGNADRIVDSAIRAGAEGATVYYGRGRGVREKMGLKGLLIVPEKEIVLIVTRLDQTDKVFETIVKEARLEEEGQGFAFLHKIDRAVGFF